MKPNLEFNELAIVLFAGEIISTFLTPKFLKQSQIIPQEWKFTQQPQIDGNTGQVAFTNGVNISVNTGFITFSENISYNNLALNKVSKLATKWVNTLHKFNYEAIEINPSSFFTFQDKNSKSFSHFIPATLLTNGDWKEASEEPLRASLSLAYIIKQKQLNIKIDDVRLRQESDNSLYAGAMFNGNFFYEVTGNTKETRLQNVHQSINSWQEDFRIFQDLVNNKFLNLDSV